MRRREFVKLLTGSAVAWPLAARAQQTSEIPKIGFVYQGSRAVMAIRLEAVLSGLRASGYAAPAQVEIVAIAERKAGALLVTADPSLYNERGHLIALAARHRLPGDLRVASACCRGWLPHS
jgi:hypothetical protein